ncbi:hypothetical protein ACLB2K_077281 [Fragaria x ananassa]
MARSWAAGDEKREEAVAVAIDNDKGSQYALKWTVEHFLAKGQSLTLDHVKQSTPGLPIQRLTMLRIPLIVTAKPLMLFTW